MKIKHYDQELGRWVIDGASNANDIEEITRRIESTATDIASNYADWRDLGFALADALGESGRSYYHRLSRFYSGDRKSVV